MPIFEKLAEELSLIFLLSPKSGHPPMIWMFQTGMFFLVDPIDGTKEFINKRDEFTVNIALVRDGIADRRCCVRSCAQCAFYGTSARELSHRPVNGKKQSDSVSASPTTMRFMVVASRSHLTDETREFIDANKVADTKNAGSSLKFCLAGHR